MAETKIATVEKLAFGGMGIVRDGATTVFLPFVIPGEKIKFKIIEGTKKPVMGELMEVIDASNARREPPCPVFGKCGGCQLQHIAYKTQLKLKREIVQETFSRIAKMEIKVEPMIPSPSHLNYRSRIKLRVRKGVLGYLSRGGKNFVPVNYCHIARKEINTAMKLAQDIIEKHGPTEVEFLLLDNDVYAILKEFHSTQTYKIPLESLQTLEKNWIPTEDFQPVFQQVNEEQNETLKALVENSVRVLKPKLAVELFCGDGNLTEALVPHCQEIVACDVDEQAITIAKTRFKTENKKIKFFHLSAEGLLEKLISQGAIPDFLLLDPPRTGAKSVIPLITDLQPPCIFYVSCNPPTIARDLALLYQYDYIAEKISPLDMFPQTAHIELITQIFRQ